MKNVESLIKAVNNSGYHVHLDQAYDYHYKKPYWHCYVFKNAEPEIGIISHSPYCLTAYSAVKNAVEFCSAPKLREIFKA
jgi:hypothetical protein